MKKWDGYCYVHEDIAANTLKKLKDKYPHAEIIVHPECPDEMRHMADFTGSTSQMSRYVKQSGRQEFIVGTEDNFVYRLKSDNPVKQFHPVHTLCEGMNTINLAKLESALQKMKHIIQVPEEVRIKAKKALDRMLTIS